MSTCKPLSFTTWQNLEMQGTPARAPLCRPALAHRQARPPDWADWPVGPVDHHQHWPTANPPTQKTLPSFGVSVEKELSAHIADCLSLPSHTSRCHHGTHIHYFVLVALQLYSLHAHSERNKQRELQSPVLCPSRVFIHFGKQTPVSSHRYVHFSRRNINQQNSATYHYQIPRFTTIESVLAKIPDTQQPSKCSSRSSLSWPLASPSSPLRMVPPRRHRP